MSILKNLLCLSLAIGFGCPSLLASDAASDRSDREEKDQAKKATNFSATEAPEEKDQQSLVPLLILDISDDSADEEEPASQRTQYEKQDEEEETRVSDEEQDQPQKNTMEEKEEAREFRERFYSEREQESQKRQKLFTSLRRDPKSFQFSQFKKLINSDLEFANLVFRFEDGREKSFFTIDERTQRWCYKIISDVNPKILVSKSNIDLIYKLKFIKSASQMGTGLTQLRFKILLEKLSGEQEIVIPDIRVSYL